MYFRARWPFRIAPVLAQPCVVVIDNASIYFPRVDVDNEAANAQAAVLVKHMCSIGSDEPVVTVVVATDRRSVHPRVVASTLDQIEVELPSRHERVEILVSSVDPMAALASVPHLLDVL